MMYLTVLLSTLLVACTCTEITISNILPRVNTTGHIIDAHDGTYNKWSPDGPWYYYAMGYGMAKQGQDMCNSGVGYGYSWIGIWKSPDMTNGSWALVRDARDDTWPIGPAYFRVHTVYNAATKLYVMWVNTAFGKFDYAVGTSADPEGPFTFVDWVDVGRASGGDFDIFVDDDGAAYFIYTATGAGHTMAVERLSDDYLSSAAAVTPTAPNVTSGVFGIAFVEAPAMFKRNNIYYALFGNCCCFCGHGSGIQVYTADQPLGPWTYHDNVGCLANTTLAPGCGCGMASGACQNYGDSLTKAQQNFVIPIAQADGSVQYVWTGDRWQSAADGTKAHDLQYWSVLEFQNVDGIDLPVQFTWQDEIQINV